MFNFKQMLTYPYLLVFELITFIPPYQFTARHLLYFIYNISLRVL